MSTALSGIKIHVRAVVEIIKQAVNFARRERGGSHIHSALIQPALKTLNFIAIKPIKVRARDSCARVRSRK